MYAIVGAGLQRTGGVALIRTLHYHGIEQFITHVYVTPNTAALN